MKVLLFIVLLTHCVIVKSETLNRFALSYSLLTMHTFDRSTKFENKIDKNGILMYNPIVGISYKNSNFLIGKDSVNSEMFGYYYQKNKFIFGAYSHIFEKWDNKKMNNYLAFKITKKIGIIPIIGYKQNLFAKDNIKFDLIITPLTINLTSSFSF